jgi:serine phosphatase RsbU (regulator of sigma subunit)/HAMP domain-containing protein
MKEEYFPLSGLQNTLSVRLRLTLLLVSAMLLVLASSLAVGVSMFVNDKGSYIMDYSLSQVRSAANSVDNQIQKTLLLSRVIHSLGKTAGDGAIEKIFHENSSALRIKSMGIWDLKKGKSIECRAILGEENKNLIHLLDQLGWDSVRFLHNPVLLAKTSADDLVVGNYIREENGSGAVYVSVLAADLNLPETLADFQVLLIDSTGDPALGEGVPLKTFNRGDIVNVSKQVLDEKFESGVKTWLFRGESYLLTYYHLKHKEFAVIGLAPDKVAFGAVYGFFLRALMLGISIILIFIGILMLTLKKITTSLQSMSEVVEKVAGGVFTYRVDTQGMKNDEIGTLATTFNLMIGKVDELVIDAVSQVESNYELEAVSTVQNGYVPKAPLEVGPISFAAQSILSAQSGGDWWFYEKLGDHILTIVGKFEGRGLAASFLSAVAFGSVSTYCVAYKNMLGAKAPNLRDLVIQLNSSLYQATLGKQKLACSIAVLDTRSGKIEVINASSPPPYLHRIDPENQTEDTAQRFEFIPLKKHAALGSNPTFKADFRPFQLEPGDFVFWNTIGLMTTLDGKGESLSTPRVFQYLAELYDQNEAQAVKISTAFMEKIKVFYGATAQFPSDDVTIALLAISKKASFKERDELT